MAKEHVTWADRVIGNPFGTSTFCPCPRDIRAGIVTMMRRQLSVQLAQPSNQAIAAPPRLVVLDDVDKPPSLSTYYTPAFDTLPVCLRSYAGTQPTAYAGGQMNKKDTVDVYIHTCLPACLPAYDTRLGRSHALHRVRPWASKWKRTWREMICVYVPFTMRCNVHVLPWSSRGACKSSGRGSAESLLVAAGGH